MTKMSEQIGKIAKPLFLVLLGLIIGISTRFIHSDNTKSKSLDNIVTDELFLKDKITETSGVTNDEVSQVKTFVDIFEGYKMDKNADKLIEMFTPPETAEEQTELDFILGNDYKQGKEKPLSRLFSTSTFDHMTSVWNIKSIEKKADITIVLIDELRIIYGGGLSEIEYGWRAKISGLTMELTQTAGMYKIKNYYHNGYSDMNTAKYEGFNAE